MAEAQKTVYNFSAGPCCLPKEVLRQAAEGCVDYNGMGISVMEMSHRSKVFCTLADKARDDVRRILNVPDNFTVFMF